MSVSSPTERQLITSFVDALRELPEVEADLAVGAGAEVGPGVQHHGPGRLSLRGGPDRHVWEDVLLSATYGDSADTSERHRITLDLGSAPVDFSGWSFDDDHEIAGTFDLSALGVVQPDEGRIVLQGQERRFAHPQEAVSAGRAPAWRPSTASARSTTR